jgi:hypothetical protein
MSWAGMFPPTASHVGARDNPSTDQLSPFHQVSTCNHPRTPVHGFRPPRSRYCVPGRPILARLNLPLRSSAQGAEYAACRAPEGPSRPSWTGRHCHLGSRALIPECNDHYSRNTAVVAKQGSPYQEQRRHSHHASKSLSTILLDPSHRLFWARRRCPIDALIRCG